MGDGEKVAAVAAVCDEFAGKLADILSDGGPGFEAGVIRRLVTNDAWLLASDVQEFFSMGETA